MELAERLNTKEFEEEIYTIAEEIVDEIKSYNVSALINGDVDVETIQEIILDGLKRLEKETNSF